MKTISGLAAALLVILLATGSWGANNLNLPKATSTGWRPPLRWLPRRPTSARVNRFSCIPRRRAVILF